MPVLPQFDPPAMLSDFSEPQKAAWSDFLSQSIDAQIAANAGNHFYNPTAMETTADGTTAEISWTAFPRLVQLSVASDQLRWKRADASRDVQDEYCEWSVDRDPGSDKITRVTFTCEGPEYWNALARVNPARVVSLYKEFVSADVVQTDLFRNGTYNPRNKWNNSTSRGAMHLIQPNNTLLAEINIAVAASIVRRIDGRLLTDEQDLIGCGRYGEPDRFSDPHIGGEVNALARRQAAVTVANPVALYIRDLSTAGWAAPDGSDPKQFWRIVRGTPPFAVRAVYEVPADKGFTVGDITINGDAIQFGAQIADFITIKIVGLACRFGAYAVPDVTSCVGSSPFAAIAAPTVAMLHEAVKAPAMRPHR